MENRRRLSPGERFAQFARSSVVALCIGLLLLPQMSRSQLAGGMLVSDFFTQLNGTVKQLEDSGHNLLDHGNVAAGQQQLLLAGTLRATIAQSQSAYQDSLNKTVSQIDNERQSTFRNLQQLVNQADEIRGKTVSDAQNLIYMSAGQANVLLGRLPFTKRSPVYFGAVPKNILNVLNPSATDLELLGFYLSDPELQQHPPEIKVNGVIIPKDGISAKFDRIQVLFPNKLRDSVRLLNPACDPMRAFTVDLRVFYTNHPWLAKVSDSFIEHADFKEFVQAGKPLYDISVIINGKVLHDGTAVDSFRTSTGSINWGCKQEVNVSTGFAASEPGAVVTGANASWINMGGRYEGSPQANAMFSGASATASGHVRGGNTEGVDVPFVGRVEKCDGGGHGELVLTGTYSHPIHSEELYAYTNTAAFGSNVSIASPARPGLRIDNAHIEIRRRACPNLVDSMDFPVGQASVSQTSKNGYFLATFDGSQLVLKGTPLLDGQ